MLSYRYSTASYSSDHYTGGRVTKEFDEWETWGWKKWMGDDYPWVRSATRERAPRRAVVCRLSSHGLLNLIS